MRPSRQQGDAAGAVGVGRSRLGSDQPRDEDGAPTVGAEATEAQPPASEVVLRAAAGEQRALLTLRRPACGNPSLELPHPGLGLSLASLLLTEPMSPR